MTCSASWSSASATTLQQWRTTGPQENLPDACSSARRNELGSSCTFSAFQNKCTLSGTGTIRVLLSTNLQRRLPLTSLYPRCSLHGSGSLSLLFPRGFPTSCPADGCVSAGHDNSAHRVRRYLVPLWLLVSSKPTAGRGGAQSLQARVLARCALFVPYRESVAMTSVNGRSLARQASNARSTFLFSFSIMRFTRLLGASAGLYLLNVRTSNDRELHLQHRRARQHVLVTPGKRHWRRVAAPERVELSHDAGVGIRSSKQWRCLRTQSTQHPTCINADHVEAERDGVHWAAATHLCHHVRGVPRVLFAKPLKHGSIPKLGRLACQCTVQSNLPTTCGATYTVKKPSASSFIPPKQDTEKNSHNDISSMSESPGPVAVPSPPRSMASRWLSYQARSWGSLSTLYASLISLNRSVARSTRVAFLSDHVHHTIHEVGEHS